MYIESIKFADIFHNLCFIKAFTKQGKVKRRCQLAFAKFILHLKAKLECYKLSISRKLTKFVVRENT